MNIVLADRHGRIFLLDLCERCGGEGVLYTSRYGGNDPDVWVDRVCPVCEGTCFAPVPLLGLEASSDEFVS